jgi:hypothetical protein
MTSSEIPTPEIYNEHIFVENESKIKSSIVDSNMMPIPVCNIENAETSAKFFVEDEKIYKKHKKNADFFGQMTATNCFVSTLFLIILSLNSSVGLLNMANLVLLALIICTSTGLVYSFKKWTASTTIVNQMETDGTPCSRTVAENTVIYTPKSHY